MVPVEGKSGEDYCQGIYPVVQQGHANFRILMLLDNMGGSHINTNYDSSHSNSLFAD